MASAVVFVVVASGGCTEIVAPVTKMPIVVVDYVDNQTKLYVMGVEATRYDNITVEVVYGNVSEVFVENNTLAWHRSFFYDNFTFYATVWYNEMEYRYNATVALYTPEMELPGIEEEKDGDSEVEIPLLVIWHGEDFYVLFEKDLPFRETMVEVSH